MKPQKNWEALSFEPIILNTIDMKTITSCIVLFLFATAALSAQKTTIDLQAFEEVKAFDRINVTLIKSDKNQAVITGDDIEEVAIVNRDGMLKIRMEIDNILDGRETNVSLYHSSDLDLVDANEGAVITSESSLDNKYLTLRAQEGGQIRSKVNTRNLDSKSVTGGKIFVSGEAANQEVTVRTGGNFDGKDLKTQQTDVTVLAGGNAVVYVSEYVEANVTAGGTIIIWGNPETVKEDKALGGSIIVRK